MKLEKWALISEIVGSIAVVVTLIILIVEVRGTTSAIREQTIDAQRYSEHERRSRIIENAGGIADLIVRSWDQESLTRAEEFRLELHYNDVLDNFEYQFTKIQSGGLSTELMNVEVLRAMMLQEPGMAEALERTRDRRDPDFVRLVD